MLPALLGLPPGTPFGVDEAKPIITAALSSIWRYRLAEIEKLTEGPIQNFDLMTRLATLAISGEQNAATLDPMSLWLRAMGLGEGSEAHTHAMAQMSTLSPTRRGARRGKFARRLSSTSEACCPSASR